MSEEASSAAPISAPDASPPSAAGGAAAADGGADDGAGASGRGGSVKDREGGGIARRKIFSVRTTNSERKTEKRKG